MDNNTINLAEISRLTGFSRTKIFNIIADDEMNFPKPVGVSNKRRQYDRSEVIDWLNNIDLKKLAPKSRHSVLMAKRESSQAELRELSMGFITGKFDPKSKQHDYSFKRMVARRIYRKTERVCVTGGKDASTEE